MSLEQVYRSSIIIVLQSLLMSDAEDVCLVVTETESMAEGGPSDGFQHRFGIVLVGKVGCGKSASGNTILGQEHFTSSFGFSAVSKFCTGCFGYACGRKVHVVDTPGLDLPELNTDDLLRDIDLWAPVVHVFLLVVKLGRFTKEQQEAVKKMESIFGERVREITMVLFTHGDSLRNSIEEFIDKAGAPLQKIIKAYGKRYHVFHNESGDCCQVTELFQKLDQMRNLNKRRFYTIDDSLRLKIILVGKAGCGKSTSSNTILGEEKFTSCSSRAMAKRCDWFYGQCCNQKVHVVDTPGLDYPEVSTEELLMDIDWCAPVLHVFLLVVALKTPMQDQQAVVEKMEEVFGQRCRDLTIILFTHGDQLMCSVETFIEKADAHVKQLLKRYKDRYHVFNNKVNDPSQVRELFTKIDRMRVLNGHKPYILEDSEVQS